MGRATRWLSPSRRGRDGGSRPGSPCQCAPTNLTVETGWGEWILHRDLEAESETICAAFSDRPSAAGPRHFSWRRSNRSIAGQRPEREAVAPVAARRTGGFAWGAPDGQGAHVGADGLHDLRAPVGLEMYLQACRLYLSPSRALTTPRSLSASARSLKNATLAIPWYQTPSHNRQKNT